MQTFDRNGGGHYDVEFTDKTVESLLGLQLAADDPEVTTFCSVVSNLSDHGHKLFAQTLTTHPKLKRVYDIARFNFAEIANPVERKWVIPSKHDVVHEMYLDLPSISSIYSTKDGQRFCVFNDVGKDKESRILTFMEYEVYFNGSVHSRLRSPLKKRINNLTQVLNFTEVSQPQMYHLSVGSHDELEVDVVDLVAYTEEGVQEYVRRNRLHILDQSQTPAVFEDGRYRGRS